MEKRTPMTMTQIKERSVAWARVAKEQEEGLREQASTPPSQEDKEKPEVAPKEDRDKNINILRKKIESGESLELDSFDGTSTKLLKRVMDVPQKTGLIERIVKGGATYAAEKLAPIASGVMGAKIFKEIFHDKVRDWVSKYMMNFLPDIIANKGAGIIKNTGELG